MVTIVRQPSAIRDYARAARLVGASAPKGTPLFKTMAGRAKYDRAEMDGLVETIWNETQTWREVVWCRNERALAARRAGGERV